MNGKQGKSGSRAKQYRYLCLLLAAGFSLNAQALLLSFDPSDQVIGKGTTTTVDLVVSDLGADILTTFDIDVLFDDTVIQYVDFEFGTGLDVFGLGTINAATDFGGGVVNVFELSFDLDEDLQLFQPDTFVLGTFTFFGFDFAAAESRTSPLDLFVWSMGGELVFDPVLGFDVTKELFPDTQSGSITVPGPSVFLLLVGGIAGFGLRRLNRVVTAQA